MVYTDVFLSYSHLNKEFVRGLADTLQATGRVVWIDEKADQDNIPAGVDWWETIKDAIEKSAVFVFNISPGSLASFTCMMELDYARATGTRIITLKLSPYDIEKDLLVKLVNPRLNQTQHAMLNSRKPLDVGGENQRVLEQIQYIDFSDELKYDACMTELLTAISTDLDLNRGHAKWYDRAKDWELNSYDGSYLLD
ncbi:MAG: toll/interleukin-1 receptor domain-containing protein, partial [Armatimonadetes bacterium]|nr:toll/interleukin-1 receptor domain-containing protein [Anaerolineae bacterium]